MRQLEARSKGEGRPIVDIVRDAIRLYIERYHPDLVQSPADTASDASSDEQ